MNALLVPGQLFGEFEMMIPSFKSNKLVALSKTLVMIPSSEVLEKIQSSAFECTFYRNLSKELIHKLYRQNHFINFRSRNRIWERIAYFLYRLGHEDFRGIVDREGLKKDSYNINLYFSMSMFESFVDSTYKTICDNLRKLLGQKVIKIDAFDENFNLVCEVTEKYLEELHDKKQAELSETAYYSFKVIDYKNLLAKNGLKKLA